MPSRKTSDKDEIDGLPDEFTSGKIHRPPSRGKIPITFILDGIYQAAAKGEAKKVAPQEVAQLKVHIEGAVKQLQAIARKLEERKREE